MRGSIWSRPRRRVPLPGPVFERKRYWLEPAGGRAQVVVGAEITGEAAPQGA